MYTEWNRNIDDQKHMLAPSSLPKNGSWGHTSTSGNKLGSHSYKNCPFQSVNKPGNKLELHSYKNCPFQSVVNYGEEGHKESEIAAMDDKRQITATSACREFSPCTINLPRYHLKMFAKMLIIHLTGTFLTQPTMQLQPLDLSVKKNSDFTVVWNWNLSTLG